MADPARELIAAVVAADSVCAPRHVSTGRVSLVALFPWRRYPVPEAAFGVYANKIDLTRIPANDAAT